MVKKRRGGRYIGAYRDDKDRIRPITSRKGTGSKTGIPVRARRIPLKKRDTGWHKHLDPETRRRKMFESTDKRMTRHNRYVQAGRRLQALANRTTDPETRRAAEADSEYYFAKAKGNNPPARTKSKGDSMDELITIEGVTKTRRAWLTDMAIRAETQYEEPTDAWRGRHNRSDVEDIDRGRAGRRLVSKKRPSERKLIPERTWIKKPSKDTVDKMEKQAGYDRDDDWEYAVENPFNGLILSSDHIWGLVADKKALEEGRLRDTRGDFSCFDDSARPVAIVEHVRLKDLKDEKWYRIDDSLYKGEALKDVFRVLGQKNIVIVAGRKDRPIAAMNREGETVMIAPGIGVGKGDRDLTSLRGVSRAAGVRLYESRTRAR